MTLEAIVVKHLGRALSYLKHYWLRAAGAFLSLLISSAARLGIVEQGSHETLLVARGLYHELYNSQFRRQV